MSIKRDRLSGDFRLISACDSTIREASLTPLGVYGYFLGGQWGLMNPPQAGPGLRQGPDDPPVPHRTHISRDEEVFSVHTREPDSFRAHPHEN